MVAAVLVAALVFLTMLLLGPGALRTTVIIGGVAVQGGLILLRGLSLRRAGRPSDRTFRGHRFVMFWSCQAGLTWLWGGEDTPASAAIYVLVGLVFAAALTAFLRFAEGRDEPAPGGDTRPLPIGERAHEE